MPLTEELHELDVVEFKRAVDGHPGGTRGTIVSVLDDDDSYLVEVTRNGKTVDIVQVGRLDVMLIQQAAKTARSNPE